MKVVKIKAEPLTSEAFRPFGQVVGQDEIGLKLKNKEAFRMGIIHMRNRGYQIDRMNHHKNSTQALVPLEGKACLVVVARQGRSSKSPKTSNRSKRSCAMVASGSTSV